jgi:hypothetical protein
VCTLYYSISHFATADEFTDTTIRIITIEKRQYGQYVCRAANKLGTAEARVELFGKPFYCMMGVGPVEGMSQLLLNMDELFCASCGKIV